MHWTGCSRTWLVLIAALVVWLADAQTNAPPPASSTNAAPPLRSLLLGDSTTAGTSPRMVAPKADQLEDVIRKLLAAEPDLPPAEVINRGINGATEKTFLANSDAWTGKLPGPCDSIFLRFGVNDVRSGTNFPTEIPPLYHELLERLRKDRPQALLTLETVIPYKGGELMIKANEAIRKMAETEKLPLLDITLDAHFRELPRWFADRHPNLAGYHVIGDEIARYPIPVIRERLNGKSRSEGWPPGQARQPRRAKDCLS